MTITNWFTKHINKSRKFSCFIKIDTHSKMPWYGRIHIYGGAKGQIEIELSRDEFLDLARQFEEQKKQLKLS